jgi:hypothetical protein
MAYSCLFASADGIVLTVAHLHARSYSFGKQWYTVFVEMLPQNSLPAAFSDCSLFVRMRKKPPYLLDTFINTLVTDNLVIRLEKIAQVARILGNKTRTRSSRFKQPHICGKPFRRCDVGIDTTGRPPQKRKHLDSTSLTLAHLVQ